MLNLNSEQRSGRNRFAWYPDDVQSSQLVIARDVVRQNPGTDRETLKEILRRSLLRGNETGAAKAFARNNGGPSRHDRRVDYTRIAFTLDKLEAAAVGRIRLAVKVAQDKTLDLVARRHRSGTLDLRFVDSLEVRVPAIPSMRSFLTEAFRHGREEARDELRKQFSAGLHWRAYREVRARIGGADVVLVDSDPGHGSCRNCGYVDETRMGVCFGCFISSDAPAWKPWEQRLFRDWLARNLDWSKAEAWRSKGYVARAVKRAYQLTISATGLPPEHALKWFEDQAFAWKGLLDDRLLASVKEVLLSNLRLGLGLDETLEDLREVFLPYVGDPEALEDPEQAQPYRLETMVRTNSTAAFNSGRKALFEDARESGFLVGYQYSAILDARTTEVCRYLDGRIFSANQQDELNRLLPPRHHNCRSIISPIPRTDMTPAEVAANAITDAEVERAVGLSGAGFASGHGARAYAEALKTPEGVTLYEPGETLTVGPEGQNGVWRTIGGNPIFIAVKAGQGIADAVRGRLEKGAEGERATKPDLKAEAKRRVEAGEIAPQLGEEDHVRAAEALLRSEAGAAAVAELWDKADKEEAIGAAPQSWDDLDSEKQTEVKEAWKDANRDAYMDSERELYAENLPDMLTDQVLGDTDWQKETVENVLNAKLDGATLSNLSSSVDVTSLDDVSADALVDAGMSEEKANAAVSAIKAEFNRAFQAEVEERARNYEIDDSEIEDAANESLDSGWNDMSNEESFEWAQNSGLIDEGTGSEAVPALPQSLDDLNGDGENYVGAGAAGRLLVQERFAQLAGAAAKNPVEGVWAAWKGSSTSPGGLALQHYAAEELGARSRLTDEQAAKAKEYASEDRPPPGPKAQREFLLGQLKDKLGEAGLKDYLAEATGNLGKTDKPERISDVSLTGMAFVMKKSGASQDAIQNAFGDIVDKHLEWERAAQIGPDTSFRSYVRAQYDATQFLLKSANVKTVDLYRAVMVPGKVLDGTASEKTMKFWGGTAGKAEPRYTVDPTEVRAGGTLLPEVRFRQGGMSSWAANQDIVNSWGGVDLHNVPKDSDDSWVRVVQRARVPASAVFSLPAYGQNVHSENEWVVLGTPWRGWDAWMGRAPSFAEVSTDDARKPEKARFHRLEAVYAA